MARRGRPLSPLELSDEERRTLQGWARSRSCGQGLALRARIILACAEGRANSEVADRLGVSRQAVGTWRARFAAQRLAGLTDQPRPGAPRRITDEQVEELIARTVGEPPCDAARWSTRSLATATGLSQSTVSRTWRALGLRPAQQPRRRPTGSETVADPPPRRRAMGVAAVHLDPPEQAFAFWVAGPDTPAPPGQRPVPPHPGGGFARQTARRSADLLFAALDTAAHAVSGTSDRRRRVQIFLNFLCRLDGALPDSADIHLVLEAHATYRNGGIQRWLSGNPRFRVQLVAPGAAHHELAKRLFAGSLYQVGHCGPATALHTILASWTRDADSRTGPLSWINAPERSPGTDGRNP